MDFMQLIGELEETYLSIYDYYKRKELFTEQELGNFLEQSFAKKEKLEKSVLELGKEGSRGVQNFMKLIGDFHSDLCEYHAYLQNKEKGAYNQKKEKVKINW